MTSIESLIACGSKVWLDSVDPELVQGQAAWGISGATSNPQIVTELIQSGRFDQVLAALVEQGLDDTAIAWQTTDELVRQAQAEFLPVWQRTGGNDGYVSFELDPLLEDPERDISYDQIVAQYVDLGKRWARGHPNRLIKVPATPPGYEAMEKLAAFGVAINVTLIFTLRQYHAARKAIWHGAQERSSLEAFKSVYSVFISRQDAYTRKHVPELSPQAQGQVGIVTAQRMWMDNQRFWAEHDLRLKQEVVFASTGTKDPADPPDKYVEALAGSDVLTNPPATNQAVQAGGKTYVRRVDQLPPPEVLEEIDAKVDVDRLHDTLMGEGLRKFAQPQKELIKLIAQKRRTLATA